MLDLFVVPSAAQMASDSIWSGLLSLRKVTDVRQPGGSSSPWYLCTHILMEFTWGFPKIRGTFLGVPIIRTIVYWGLYWGPPILGNYHMTSVQLSFLKLFLWHDLCLLLDITLNPKPYGWACGHLVGFRASTSIALCLRRHRRIPPAGFRTAVSISSGEGS